VNGHPARRLEVIMGGRHVLDQLVVTVSANRYIVIIIDDQWQIPSTHPHLTPADAVKIAAAVTVQRPDLGWCLG
jgi:hypothetical protein